MTKISTTQAQFLGALRSTSEMTGAAAQDFETYLAYLSGDGLNALWSTMDTEPAQWAHTFAENARRRAIIHARAATPLLHRYLLAGRGMGRAPALTDSWMALAERDTMALTLSAPETPWTMTSVKPSVMPLLTTYLAGQYAEAHTYLWSSAILQVIRACPLPSHILSLGLAPFPTTYHAFENACVATKLDETTPRIDEATPHLANGYLLTPSLGGSRLWLPISAASGKQFVTDIATWDLPYGMRYPEDCTPEQRDALHLPLAMLTMLQTPTTVVTETRLPRGFRRHADFSATDAAQTVSVVGLRRDAAHAVQAYNSESVAWRHKWWVSGHFRAQWMPSTQSHRPTWIAPYLKGDPDLPMLDHVYTVRK